MIYPNNFETKIGFAEVRSLLKGKCISSLGREMVDAMAFSDSPEQINEWFAQTREFRRLEETAEDFPLNYFFDVRSSVARIRLEGTHLDENELFDLKRSLDTICGIVAFLDKKEGGDNAGEEADVEYAYPALHRLADGVCTFPVLVKRIDQILDKFGNIRDNASPQLLTVRRELARTAGSISHTLNSILRSAQNEGLIEKDASPTMRDGRLVIPVAPGMKRKIKGIVHDESATGKTVFVEPTEVVEANNRIRELEAEERREIVKILTEFAKLIRPHVREILDSYMLLAAVDFIRAKCSLGKQMKAFEPTVGKVPYIDWTSAEHPLLKLSLESQGRKVIPLDIVLTKDKRILIISGPNAGGKSVCLKTVGLLQYMLQCGLSVPMGERSRTGVFQNIMIDIGDEQSIENDLSTYSSHLLNMKNMMRRANDRTLLLIDEFGTGTEPNIGGAIAESVLKQFCIRKAYGVITTHYQNLKHFADSHEGVVNGAMLYDRNEMKPLFQLQIGRPGSSFAIEIARKIGMPDEVIRDASDIVGSDYIQSDKYLQDIVRDKRYWENKRQAIHQREKDMEKTIARYEAGVKELEQSRKDILRKAREQAENLLKESNSRIENTIKKIRESQADKEETKKIREELNSFKEELNDIDSKSEDEKIARKIAQIEQRRERREKRKKDKAAQKADEAKRNDELAKRQDAEKNYRPKPGDTVRIKGLESVGKVESVSGNTATIIFGDMRTKIPATRLVMADAPKEQERNVPVSRTTRNTIDEHRKDFKSDLDVRGMRGDEAINTVSYFIDDAILIGMPRVRILHGKGNGILRQLIRQYLATVPNVSSFHDEHVQFGGAGITVVDL